MGHTDPKGLVRDVDHGHVTGVHIAGPKKLKPCHQCRVGKLRRSSFGMKSVDDFNVDLKKIEGRVRPGGLVHLDGVGPIETEGIGGYRGFYTFVDEDTRAIWVKLYKLPRQCYALVKEFGRELKSVYDGIVKVIHTDQAPMWNKESSQWKELEHSMGFTTRYSSRIQHRIRPVSLRERRSV